MQNRFVKNRKGQALLFVVVAMTVALAVGVAVSSRTLSSLRRTTNTDTATRVTASSEGGIEWFLRQPISVLETLSDGNGGNSGAECPTGTTGSTTNTRACVLTYSPQSGDAVTAQAEIVVDPFTVNSDDGSYYWAQLDSGSVQEIRLVSPSGTFYNGNVRLCWQTSDSSNNGWLYYILYNSTGVTAKQIIAPRVVNGSSDVQGSVAATTSTTGFDNCYDINGINNQYGLRVKAMYVPVRVAIYPLSAGFPAQGYKITSTGQVRNSNNTITSTKQLVVYRSFTFMPAVLDYGLYSDGVID